MRQIAALLLTLASLAAALPAAAGQPAADGLLQLAQAEPNTTNRNIPAQGQGVRPARYVCVIKPPASDKQAGRYSCPARAGRVGESCRCQNAVGSGRLVQY